MSGLEPLQAITEGCCALRYYAGLLKRAWDGDKTEPTEFSCSGCGRVYRRDWHGGWREVSAVELVKEIEGHHELR